MTKTYKVVSCEALFLAVGGLVYAAHQRNQPTQPAQPTPVTQTSKQIKPPYHDIYLTLQRTWFPELTSTNNFVPVATGMTGAAWDVPRAIAPFHRPI